MATQELVKPSLTRQIRKQILLNQERGDRKSLEGSTWCAYGQDIEMYESEFSGVLNGSISDVLKDRTFPVVIDLMAPSRTIATLFEKFPDKPKLGLAVSLDDLRSDQQKAIDKGLSVEQIAGDILRSSTWNEIEKKLQGHKADLVMERALAGFNCIPSYPRLYAMLLNKAWDLLSKANGILLFQGPFRKEIDQKTDTIIYQWINNLLNSGISVMIDSLLDNDHHYIKIVKTPNSPEKLPFLG